MHNCRVERGKEDPHLNRKIYVLAASSTDYWKHYAAKTTMVAIISGNTEIEESYSNDAMILGQSARLLRGGKVHQVRFTPYFLSSRLIYV